MTSVTYSDQKPKTELFGETEAGGSFGIGPLGIGTDVLSPSIEGNLGPLEGTVTQDGLNSQVTIFDIGLTAFIGVNISLKLPSELFSTEANTSFTPDISSQTTEPTDATSVTMPSLYLNYMDSKKEVMKEMKTDNFILC